jgi:hypothetical protein
MEITTEQKNSLIGKIENVLRTNFQGPKTELRIYRDRINFACPYCGDSHDPYKKRANIYWKNLLYHCYNGGCQKHTNLVQFLRDFEQSVGTKEDVIQYLNKIKESQTARAPKEYLQHSVFSNLISYGISIDVIREKLNLKKPFEDRRIDRYLKARFMHQKMNNFLYDPKEDQLYIFNFAQDQKTVIGWQIRNFKKGREKYISYNIEKINRNILDRKIDLSDDEIMRMNTISLYFGIMLANFERPVTVFEGPIDSMLISNSIAIAGADKPTEMFDEIVTIRYLFDNDVVGRRIMEKKLKRKKSVFMWSKFLKDHKINEKIKDFNELVEYCWKNQNGAIKEINKYFTTNPLDIRSV